MILKFLIRIILLYNLWLGNRCNYNLKIAYSSKVEKYKNIIIIRLNVVVQLYSLNNYKHTEKYVYYNDIIYLI